MGHTIAIELDVAMELSDGVRLRADIYRPEGPGANPAILIRTPYNKIRFEGGLFDPVALARAGYAVVIQDIRGRYASEGVWERHRMFEVEGTDGFESVEWIAEQRWCDGNVALAGPSYLTAMQWIAAMAAPPHLKAFVPCVGDIGTNIAPNPETGAVSFYSAANALPMTAFDLVEKMKAQGEDVSEIAAYLERMRQDPQWVVNYLPFKQFPLAKYPAFRAMLEQRLTPPSPEVLRERRRYDRVKVPGLHVGGWFDQLEWSIFEHCRKLKQHAGTEFARSGQHLLVGPWDHGSPKSFLGELEFGPSSADELTLRGHVVDFYDKYLRGRDVDVPAVRYFVMGRNEWRTGETWPLPQTRWERWFLHSGGRANTAGGDGALNREEPGLEPRDRYAYDPLDPVPTIGGRLLPMAGLVPGPFDQALIERRNDVLCYTSPELTEEMEVTGPLALQLAAATTAADTDFTAKLTDVFPDGRSILIAEGIQRASHRRRDGRAAALPPDEPVRYSVSLGNTSYAFRKGHRIRLHVSSSNFPLYDRNMNTGRPSGEDAVGVIAEQTVYHETGWLSYLDLPVIPNAEEGAG
ncbi:CocE/NonD family hydrolase [Cohnella caldifontis]|uniref:CocE/NonD family hydrolase n=1 Tax=Cohnella caldifontis TaxID=3027471 RepID=UPI0023ED7293|nr:CocE/NonD family hydrolase [Cohnella sp. YIM B05605]